MLFRRVFYASGSMLMLALAFHLGQVTAHAQGGQIIEGGNIEATLYTPDGPGPFASAIVIHTSQGLVEADRQYCAALAREGYDVFALSHTGYAPSPRPLAGWNRAASSRRTHRVRRLAPV